MRLLVTGASGFLGWNFCRRHAARFEIVPAWHTTPPQPDSTELRADLSDPVAITRLWAEAAPDAVLHLGAMTSVAACEADPDAAQRVNVDASRQLAELAAAARIRLVHASTDLVFDGSRAPYVESDPLCPLSLYGRTKAAAERAVLGASATHLVARIALTYGRTRRGDIRQVQWILDQAARGEPVTLFEDEYRTPIDALTVADALAELVLGTESGPLHLAGTERISRLDFARRLLQRAGLAPELARPGRIADSPIPRAADTSLITDRAARTLKTPLPDVAAGLDRALAGR